MSLRKVSDLEGLTIAQAYEDGLSDNVLNSLIEISYLSSQYATSDVPPVYSFVSMYVRYSDIRDDILSTILSSHSQVTFSDHVEMLCGLCLSGNLYMNMEIDDDELENGEREYDRDGKGYEMFIHTTQNTLCAIGGPNLLFSTYQNILQANSNIIKDEDGNVIADFESDGIQFNQPLNVAGSITSTGDIHSGGDVYGNIFHGTALSAKWADVAELYESDSEYEPGTLVKFGGQKEITIADDEANAVVTMKPGMLLNKQTAYEEDSTNVGIALVGRTPVKVLGKISKFDKLAISSIPGVASKKSDDNSKTIAIALQDKFKDEIGLVECVVKFVF